MKVIATSSFHSNLEHVFRLPSKEGAYYRHVNKCSSDCACGWPVHHTSWIAPEGWSVRVQWAFFGGGRSNVIIYLDRVA